MAHFLRGRNFENVEAVEVDLTEFFTSKTRDWYRRGKTNLAQDVSTLKSRVIYFFYSLLFRDASTSLAYWLARLTALQEVLGSISSYTLEIFLDVLCLGRVHPASWGQLGSYLIEK